MSKNLNVSLTVNADTRQARAQLDELSKALRDVAKLPSQASNLFDDTEIRKASQAALELEQHLAKAVNVNTGKLDLSRFSSSLKASNKNLNDYYSSLLAIGKDGQQAFLKLTSAIASAEVPTARVSARMREFLTTLKNTARWQVSSSILHGLVGAVQSAYGYAQDLNESLNNIRIVTGQSVEQMSKFAKEANRAAKALSTTTTEYTDAALIYYQQGLSDKEVQERTEATIKMANVSRQSAETVSEQLTAVWNNFDNGTKALEYYADVMTALGAATASSSEEIATGLEKFAAVADTVGLSYEYASAALATVTATTRQSADIVGTAFKTLFARIQDLELGKTLDDGVSLGKYSQALEAVGISIIDQQGQLRDMNSILDDMGEKWNTLSKAQQTSLAQIVGGTRQYTQLIALMDNWDFFQENLNTAITSEGALSVQAEIYAESWEGAADRVTAAAEGIYDTLINDKFFIDLLNGVEKVLTGLKGLVDGFGGLGGVLTAVGGIFMSYYAKQMPTALSNLKSNLMVLTGQANKEMLRMQDETIQTLEKAQAMGGAPNSAINIQYEGQRKVIEMKRELVKVSNLLTQTEREEYEAQIQNVEAMYKSIQAMAEKQQAAEKELQVQQEVIAQSAVTDLYSQRAQLQKLQKSFSEYEAKAAKASDTNRWQDAEKYVGLMEEAEIAIVELEAQVEELMKTYGFTNQKINEFLASQDKLTPGQTTKVHNAVANLAKEFVKLNIEHQNFNELDASVAGQVQHWREHQNTIAKTPKDVQQLVIRMKSYKDTIKQIASENPKLGIAADQFKKLDVALADANPDVDQLLKLFEELSRIITDKVKTASDQCEQEIGELSFKLQNLNQDTKQLSENALKTANAGQRLTNSLQNAGSATLQAQTHTVQLSETFMSVAAAGMVVWSTITSIKSAIDVWTDDSATGIEKVGAAFSLLLSVTGAYVTIQRMISTGQGKITFSRSAETVATWGQTVAQNALNLSLAPYAALIAVVTAALLILVGIIVGITAAVKALTNAYNKDADAMRDAKNAANELGEAFKETKDAYEELKQSVTEYSEMQNALNSLTQGTKEWNEALEESNAHVLEMLREFPTLAKYFENQNGRYVLTDAQAALDEAKFKMNEREAAYNTATIAALIATNRSTRTDAVRDNDVAHVSTIWGAQAQGSQVLTNNDRRAALAALQSAYDSGQTHIFEEGQYEDFAEILRNSIGAADSTIKALWSHREALEELTKETSINNEQMRALLEANAHSANQNSQFYAAQSAQGQSLIDTIVAERAATQLGNDAWLKENKQNWKAQGRDAWEEAYLKYRFGDDADQYRMEAHGGNNVTLQKKDENGKWVNVDDKKENLSKQAIWDALATMTATNFLGDTAGESTEDLELYNTMQAFGQQLENIGASSDDILAIQRDLVIGEGVSIQHLSPDEFEKLKDMGAEMGNMLSAEMLAQLNTAINAYDPNIYWNNYIQKTVQEIETMFKEASAELDIDANAFESYAGSLAEAAGKTQDLTNATAEERAEQMRLNKEFAKMTVAHYKLAKGINDVQKIWKDNAEVLKANNHESLEFHEAVGQLTTALESAFGMQVDATFVKQNLKDIELMVEGDIDALNRLRKKLNEEYVLGLQLDDQNLNKALLDELNRLQDLALENPLSTELLIDNSDAITALNKALATGQATIQDIEAMFNNANLAMPEYHTAELPGDVVTSESTVTGELFGKIPFSYTTKATTTTMRKVPYFGDNAPTVSDDGEITSYGGGDSLQVSSAGLSNNALDDILNYGEESDRIEKGKEIEDKAPKRYKETNDLLDDITRQLEKANRELDRMYGKSRVTKMGEIISMLETEKGVIEDQLALSQEYINMDLNKMAKAESEAIAESGLDPNQIGHLQVDKNGNITNYTEFMSQLYSQYEKTLDEDLLAKIEALETAIENYDNSREKSQDLLEEYIAIQDEIKQATYDQFAEALSIDLEISDRSMQKLERQIAALGDNIFSRVELGKLLVGENGSGGKYSILNDKYTTLSDAKTDLDAKYAAQQITTAQYAQGLKELEQAALDGVDAFQDLKDTMSTYYADTLTMVDDIIQFQFSQMDHLSSVMEHYDNIINLTGGEKDYDAKAVILEGQAYNKENIVASKKEYYDMMQAQADRQKEEMDEILRLAGGDITNEAYLMAKAEWEAAQEYANQAQLDMLSAVEEWAEAVNAVLENELAAAADDLEKALTNGTSFDALNTTMEQTRSMQEEWLTTTNQVYETNKIMRTAQQAMDTATTKAAKDKLKTFITQTQELQKQEKLSKFELDVQQARYDLLLAEIALEEAQNAKSTVRLQRDSEGNFGYVYTADQDNIAKAQQDYEDAENALYNLSLDGINKYNEKYFQLREQMFADLTAIANDHTLSEEERLKKMAEVEEYYGKMIADASYLRAIASTAESYELMSEFKQGYAAQQEGLANTLAGINEAYRNGDIEGEAAYEQAIQKAMVDHYGTLSGYSDGFYGHLVQNAQDYQKDVGGANSPIAAVTEAWSSQFTQQTGFATKWNTDLFGTDGNSGIIGKGGASWKAILSGAQTASSDWRDAVVGADGKGGYLKTVTDAFAQYEKDITDINNAVGLSMQGQEGSVASRAEALTKIIGKVGANDTLVEGQEGMLKKSKEIRDLLTGEEGLIKKMGSTATEAGNIADKFQRNLIPQTENLGTKFDNLATEIGDAITELLRINGMSLNDKSATYTITYKYVTEGGPPPENPDTGGGEDPDLIGGTGLFPGMVTIPPITIQQPIFPEGEPLPDSAYQVGDKVKASPDAGSFVRYYTKETDGSMTQGPALHPVVASTMKDSEIIQKYFWNDLWYYLVRTTYGNDFWFNGYQLASMATGGYTGNWGPSGKLAVLHEKELVLNAHDTENMLMMISMVRDMMSLIDIPGLATSMMNPSIGTMDSSQLEQMVHIDASFPSVTDRYEIEEALGNLINTASQFANRKHL